MVPEACNIKEEQVRKTAGELAGRLRALGDPMAQYDYLLTLGMERPVHTDIKKDAYRIAGCKTAIWIRIPGDAERPSGEGAAGEERRYFEAESDSLLVRGVLALFEEVYQGVSKKTVAECPPLFLTEISEDVIYRDIRQNGLQKCYERIAGLC